jgi:hypothetical protein
MTTHILTTLSDSVATRLTPHVYDNKRLCFSYEYIGEININSHE